MEEFNPLKVALKLFGILAVMAAIVFSTAVVWSRPYDRREFPHWSDLDRDGLDTREELLQSRKLGKVWVCPYTGFTSSNPADFEVDHIISLKQAWEYGAEHWTRDEREKFANDELNLELVKAEVNSSKGNLKLFQWTPLNLFYFPVLIRKYRLVCDRYLLDCPDPDPDGIAEILIILNGLRYPDVSKAVYPTVRY